jgi:hypothetical protein
MNTKEGLMVMIRSLMRDLASNGMQLRLSKSSNMVRTEELLHVRAEILKSIVHRQGLLIEVLKVELEYKEEVA